MWRKHDALADVTDVRCTGVIGQWGDILLEQRGNWVKVGPERAADILSHGEWLSDEGTLYSFTTMDGFIGVIKFSTGCGTFT